MRKNDYDSGIVFYVYASGCTSSAAGAFHVLGELFKRANLFISWLVARNVEICDG